MSATGTPTGWVGQRDVHSTDLLAVRLESGSCQQFCVSVRSGAAGLCRKPGKPNGSTVAQVSSTFFSATNEGSGESSAVFALSVALHQGPPGCSPLVLTSIASPCRNAPLRVQTAECCTTLLLYQGHAFSCAVPPVVRSRAGHPLPLALTPRILTVPRASPRLVRMCCMLHSHLNCCEHVALWTLKSLLRIAQRARSALARQPLSGERCVKPVHHQHTWNFRVVLWISACVLNPGSRAPARRRLRPQCAGGLHTTHSVALLS